MSFLGLVLVACLFACSHAAVEADKVDGRSLPGYQRPLPQTHYSGYIETALPNGKHSAHTHYWLVLADDVPSAPVVVWQQGGPGGSSLIGFLTENGPLTLNDASFSHNGTVPTVFDNLNGWTGEHTMLYVRAARLNSCAPRETRLGAHLPHPAHRPGRAPCADWLQLLRRHRHRLRPRRRVAGRAGVQLLRQVLRALPGAAAPAVLLQWRELRRRPGADGRPQAARGSHGRQPRPRSVVGVRLRARQRLPR